MPKPQIKEAFTKVLLYDSGAELPLARKYIEAVVAKKKKSTIREGILIFDPNCQLFLRSSADTARIPVVVSSYVSKRVKHLSLRDAREDGFSTSEALISELRQYYPLLEDDSIVTIIKFKLS